MKITHDTQKSIFDLAKLILNDRNRTEIESYWPLPRSGKIPADVRCVGVDEDFLFIKSKEGNALYRHCLSLLSDETSLVHISFSELDKELWHFYCEIYCDSAKFTNDSEIKSAVNGLIKRLNKPLIEYEVLISLDKHLQLNARSIELAGVRFVQMSESCILDWGIRKDASIWHKHFYEAVVGHSVAMVFERCYGSDKAVENAKIKLNLALDALRVALFMDHDQRIVDWRIHDQQVLFRIGEEIAVREKGNSTEASLKFHSGFRSWEFKIDGVYLNQIVESKRVIDLLFAPVTTRSKIYGRMRRALQWIGGSATREGFDDKVVDICTGLETLLTTQQDGMKGKAISLRTMLLYSRLDMQPRFNPVTLLRLYQKRSWVIHGSYKDICSDYDYKLGQVIAIDILKNVLAYIRAHNITQHAAFIKDLESDSILVKHYKEVVDDASKLLKKSFTRGTS